MNVIVDTSVWSLALRRATPINAARELLQELVLEGRATIIGPVRQELLSGVKATAQFEILREKLRAFPDLELETEDHEEAARFYNACRARGVQGSNTDFLLCAVGSRREYPIFTTDRDFVRFAKFVPISLFVS